MPEKESMNNSQIQTAPKYSREQEIAAGKFAEIAKTLKKDIKKIAGQNEMYVLPIGINFRFYDVSEKTLASIETLDEYKALHKICLEANVRIELLQAGPDAFPNSARNHLRGPCVVVTANRSYSLTSAFSCNPSLITADSVLQLPEEQKQEIFQKLREEFSASVQPENEAALQRAIKVPQQITVPQPV